jgi:hypothetical protein
MQASSRTPHRLHLLHAVDQRLTADRAQGQHVCNGLLDCGVLLQEVHAGGKCW